MDEDKELQIGCYLTRKEARALADYATSLRLRRPSLCVLLVQHELLCPQLSDRVEGYHGSLPKKGAVRVTTRVDAALKDAFQLHASSLCLGSDDAAAKVFLRELDERWLEQSLAWRGIVLDSSAGMG